MEYRALGSTAWNVSALAFGAWQIGDSAYWGVEDAADAQAAVDAALDGGINLFDTAEMYGGGESERVLGKCLGARRKEVYVASKAAPEHCTPDGVRGSCEKSLERLGTDYIDLYQIHWPFRETPFEDVYAVLDSLKDEGKIRAAGVSNFGVQDLNQWMAAGTCVSNQLGYNLAFRAIEYEILPACLRHNVGVLAYMPLLQGLLTGRWKAIDEIPAARRRTRHFSCNREGTRHTEAGQEDLFVDLLDKLGEMANELDMAPATLALAWAMAQKGVASVIVGARRRTQLQRNIDAASVDLDEPALNRLNSISEPLKQALGNNADLWLSGDERRIR